MVEQLRQRVLQQRQAARLCGHIGHELGDQRLLDHHAFSRRGAGDRLLQLGSGERGHRNRVVAQRGAEATVKQRTVVEVGTDRGDHPDSGTGIADQLDERGEEPFAFCRGRRERVELLELVDHENHVGVADRNALLHCANETPVLLEQRAQRRWRIDSDSQERGLDLVERVDTRKHRHHESASGSHLRKQTGAHQARLARTGRSNHRHETGHAQLLLQPSELRDRAMEIGSVGLAEGPQTLVRVAFMARHWHGLGSIAGTVSRANGHGIQPRGDEVRHSRKPFSGFERHRLAENTVEPARQTRAIAHRWNRQPRHVLVTRGAGVIAVAVAGTRRHQLVHRTAERIHVRSSRHRLGAQLLRRREGR